MNLMMESREDILWLDVGSERTVSFVAIEAAIINTLEDAVPGRLAIAETADKASAYLVRELGSEAGLDNEVYAAALGSLANLGVVAEDGNDVWLEPTWQRRISE